MKALSRSFVWWPGIDENIESYVRTCETCQINQNMPNSAPVHPWESVKSPWSRLHIDFAGPFMGKMFLVIFDSYSKWLDVYPMSDIKAPSTIANLRRCFAANGIPFTIVSDNGPTFISDDFEQFCKRNGIQHILTRHLTAQQRGLFKRLKMQ